MVHYGDTVLVFLWKQLHGIFQSVPRAFAQPKREAAHKDLFVLGQLQLEGRANVVHVPPTGADFVEVATAQHIEERQRRN